MSKTGLEAVDKRASIIACILLKSVKNTQTRLKIATKLSSLSGFNARFPKLATIIGLVFIVTLLFNNGIRLNSGSKFVNLTVWCRSFQLGNWTDKKMLIHFLRCTDWLQNMCRKWKRKKNLKVKKFTAQHQEKRFAFIMVCKNENPLILLIFTLSQVTELAHLFRSKGYWDCKCTCWRFNERFPHHTLIRWNLFTCFMQEYFALVQLTHPNL